VHRFKFKKSELYCEDVPVRKIARAVGSPCYVYSMGTFVDHFLKLKRAFADLNGLICYSMKSNSNLTILKKLISLGAGLDIVSGGELYRARKVGADPKRIVFASVGKSPEEVDYAIKTGILQFNVESESELELVNRVASQHNKVQDIAIRLNPDVRANTHSKITTGTKENKFGLNWDRAFKCFLESYQYPFLRFSGVHLHIGSQITEPKPFLKAMRVACDFIAKLRVSGIFIETLNVGGGLGVVYSDEKPQTADQFAKALRPFIKNTRLRILLEPGRFISGNSGILLTSVLHLKETDHKRFAIVDAGMNDMMRPSLYDAYHEIHVVKRANKRSNSHSQRYDVVGPVCESGDTFAKARPMPTLHQGDLLAIMTCGAYGYVMSNNYNSRPRLPEVIVKGKAFYVSKKRETYDDLIRGEKILRV
jgi:diaminopimelate decarboxylase